MMSDDLEVENGNADIEDSSVSDFIAVLVAAREAAKLSHAQVAAQLRLELRVVRALDVGDFSVLGAPVFIKGHLRAYEKLLRLAPNELVWLYESIERPADEWLARPAQQEQVKPANLAQWGLVVVLILAVIAIAMFLLPDSPDNAPEPEVLEVPVALALPDDADAGVDANADAIDEADAGLAVEFLPDADSAVAAADPFELAPVPVAPAATTRVAMVFAEDSWVEVADANGRLLVNVIAAGSQREFSGVAPFSFFLGNAKGVQLSFDGVPYSITIWSIRDKTARFKMTAADILALKDSAE